MKKAQKWPNHGLVKQWVYPIAYRGKEHMTTAEMIFDGLVWLIGGLVVVYMSKRYWVMFRNRNNPSSGGCSDQSSCSSCPSKKQSAEESR